MKLGAAGVRRRRRQIIVRCLPLGSRLKQKISWARSKTIKQFLLLTTQLAQIGLLNWVNAVRTDLARRACLH